MPDNAKDIACSGAYCAVICSDGYRSEDIWRIICKHNNQWSHEAFSPCLTCPDVDVSDSIIVSHVTYRRKLPSRSLQSIQIGCSNSNDQLIVANFDLKSSQKVARLRCACRRHKARGSSHPRKCEWRFRGKPIPSVNPIQCISLDSPGIIPQSIPFPRDTMSKFQFLSHESCEQTLASSFR